MKNQSNYSANELDDLSDDTIEFVLKQAKKVFVAIIFIVIIIALYYLFICQ